MLHFVKKKYFALDLALNMSKKHMYVSDLSPRVCALLLAEIDLKSEKKCNFVSSHQVVDRNFYFHPLCMSEIWFAIIRFN